MKILPSDELTHKPDYNKNYRKYFKEEVVDTLNKESTAGMVSTLFSTLLQRLGLTTILD